MENKTNRFLDMASQIAERSFAYENIESRGQEAYEYCQKYLSSEVGKNIWHAILDDAIRMREEKEDISEHCKNNGCHIRENEL